MNASAETKGKGASFATKQVDDGQPKASLE